MESTLSLTMSCITFLCQKHHDPQLLEDKICENVVNGAYVLHEYAATTWLDLVERCVRLDPTEAAAPDLVRLLKEISTNRSNLTYVAECGDEKKLTMRTFKRMQPQLFEMLSKAAQFRDLRLSSPRASAEGKSQECLPTHYLRISQIRSGCSRPIDNNSNVCSRRAGD
jgi:hypothetical protein